MKTLVCALFAACFASALAQGYVGADEALRRIQAKAPQAGTLAPLSVRLREFRTNTRTLNPNEAAAQWVAFAKGATPEQQGPSGSFGDGLPLGTTVALLPSPASWPEIERILKASVSAGDESERTLSLLLVAAVLQNDAPAEWQTLEKMRSIKSQQGQYSGNSVLSIYTQLAAWNHDPVRLARGIRLQAQASPNSTILVPDLVGVLGAEKAALLLREIILTHPISTSAMKGEATPELARRVALENSSKLKVAQWDLALSVEAGPLFEALRTRFPLTLPGDRNHSRGPEAQMFFVLGLIVHGHADRAAAIVDKNKGEPLASGDTYTMIGALQKAGYSEAAYAFLSQVLSRRPGLPLWPQYIQLAADTGHSAALIPIIRRGLANSQLPPETRTEMEARLADALLADGQVEEGVKMLRRFTATYSSPHQRVQIEGPNGSALKVAKIGYLLKNQAWLDEGVLRAVAAVKPFQTAIPGGFTYSSPDPELPEFLFKIGRGTVAERVLISEMQSSSPPDIGTSNMQALVELASIYERSGRPADVVALLDKADSWGASDLAQFYKTSLDSAERPFAYVVASALASLGRKEEALPILEAVIRQFTNFDPAYKMYLDLKGDDALPLFRSVYALNQFEERPLIWIAEAMRRDGKLDEAEKFARRAIQVDPSDGDQHLGARLMAYSLLADIREAQGAPADAEPLRNAVKAIRMSEEADKYREAGLLSDAIKMYKQSLILFQDAYCIQSRLAVSLAAEGRYDEAAEHYRRAYELMPQSFGRVETHCLGCERAFEGSFAQSIAEKVFGQLVAKSPDKPQVHYLLGYLREDQQRYKDAVHSYEHAVALDPDYLNAWIHLANMGEHEALGDAEKDRAARQIIRLDPQERYAKVYSLEVRDL